MGSAEAAPVPDPVPEAERPPEPAPETTAPPPPPEPILEGVRPSPRVRSRLGPAAAWLLNLPLTLLILFWIIPALRRMADDLGWRESPAAIEALSGLSRLARSAPGLAILIAAVILSAAASAFPLRGAARWAYRAWAVLALLAQAALAGTVAWLLLRLTSALLRS